MHVTLDMDGDSFDLYLVRENGTIKVEVDGDMLDVKVAEDTPDGTVLDVKGERFTVKLASDDVVRVDGEDLPFQLSDFHASGAPGAHDGGGAGAARVKPPMPGKLVAVKVAVGDEVKKGDILFVLEAMKMQNEVPAPTGGTVKAVNAAAGANVEAKDVVVEIG